ncbi:enoyl-CoA hydratase-related protein [Streptomyces sp. NBC_00631]|uniref:enoyl-CoA hydratase-related protein n=1 Tax=Streptomyces sp. NBC_00631 TaxID=2975793 RepID=UPI00386AF31B
MVQTLAAGDLQRELTYDGLRAVEAKGNKGGRRPASAADKTDAVHTAYLEGRSIATLARDHDVSRGAIRTAVADLLPQYTVADPSTPAPELPVTLDMSGKVADFLRAADLDEVERAALDQGGTVRRGQGCTLRDSATHTVHRQILDYCQPPGVRLSKPMNTAVNGSCPTLVIELMLAADIAVAAESATFAQLEISRGIFPFGGGTLRFPKAVGWGNAMRWMLTAEVTCPGRNPVRPRRHHRSAAGRTTTSGRCTDNRSPELRRWSDQSQPPRVISPRCTSGSTKGLGRSEGPYANSVTSMCHGLRR